MSTESGQPVVQHRSYVDRRIRPGEIHPAVTAGAKALHRRYDGKRVVHLCDFADDVAATIAPAILRWAAGELNGTARMRLETIAANIEDPTSLAMVRERHTDGGTA